MFLDDEQKNNIKKSLKTSMQEESFCLVMKGSYKSFKFSVHRMVFLLIAFAISFIYSSYYTSLNSSAIEKIVERSNTIILALLAIIITGYAIFQAMASKTVLTFLSAYTDSNSNESVFNTMQHTTFFMTMNYIIIIVINYLLLTILDIFTSHTFSGMLTFSLMVLYCAYISYWIVEMKSFMYNLYQIFQVVSGIQLLDPIQNDDEKNETGLQSSNKDCD